MVEVGGGRGEVGIFFFFFLFFSYLLEEIREAGGVGGGVGKLDQVCVFYRRRWGVCWSRMFILAG